MEAQARFDARHGILQPSTKASAGFPSTEELIKNVLEDWHIAGSYPIDARGTAYSLAVFSAKHLGESQYYVLAGRDEGRQ